MASPLLIWDTAIYFLLLSFSSPSMSTVMHSSVVLDSGLPVPHYWPDIWCWWITIFFSSTMLFILPLSYILCCVSGIATDNEIGSTSSVLGEYLVFFGTIISSLNFSPRSLLTKVLLSVIIEVLIICSNVHENMVLHSTPSPRTRKTVTGCSFNTKGVL